MQGSGLQMPALLLALNYPIVQRTSRLYQFDAARLMAQRLTLVKPSRSERPNFNKVHEQSKICIRGIEPPHLALISLLLFLFQASIQIVPTSLSHSLHPLPHSHYMFEATSGKFAPITPIILLKKVQARLGS
jgi:hypothetical protein